MKERNLTKAALSKDTGLPYTTIDSILKRDTFEKVKISTLQILKNYFDVSLDYLMIDEIVDKDYGKPQIQISTHEQRVVKAYRRNPVMQAAVDRLLGVSGDTAEISAEFVPDVQEYRAAWNNNLTEEEAVQLVRQRYTDAKRGLPVSTTYASSDKTGSA
jgi:transcriptional regulator with XRE-family HTH domain